MTIWKLELTSDSTTIGTVGSEGFFNCIEALASHLGSKGVLE